MAHARGSPRLMPEALPSGAPVRLFATYSLSQTPSILSVAMLLFLSALLSIAMGCFVGVAGQERRAKIWFLLLCASTTLPSIGLWVEVNVANRAFLAARANMTSTFMIAAMGTPFGREMCGWRLNKTVMILLTLVSVVDSATVWVTNLYFTGEIYHYAWGIYIAENRLICITPLLITIVALYGVFNLWAN
jgi:hypothetical protein